MILYREYPPSPALTPHVACLWTAHVVPAPEALPFVHRVLPDNCVDILWQDSGSPAFAVGMMSRAIFVPSAGPVRTVAVRFLPGAARRFLGLPLAELTDGRADLDLLWGRSGAGRLQDGLWERELTDRERLDLIEAALLVRLADGGGGCGRGAGGLPEASPARAPSLARAAVTRIEACGGALRVEALADELRVSRQHLAGQFREQVGLTPKMFARITRFRRATERARSQPAVDWAALALDCGYFDQSHLIRDFHDFASTTPERFS